MDQNIFFNKWWILLLQGALLMTLSYAHLNNPLAITESVLNLTGFIALLTGSSSLIGYFLADKEENNQSDLFLAILSCIVAILFITRSYFDAEMVIWLLIAYMLLNTIYLITNTSQLRSIISCWWICVPFLAFTILLNIFIITRLPQLDKAILLFIGFQFFGNGLLLVLMAFVLRKLQNEYSKTISQIRDNTTP